MRLTGTRLLNYSKMIGMHEMKKMLDGIELCRKHILDAPNQRGGGNDACFQAIIVTPGHGDDPRCVRRKQIIISIVREIGEGVVLVSLYGGVLGDLVGGAIGQAQWGGGSVMAAILCFV
jgi:hypothetical protein